MSSRTRTTFVLAALLASAISASVRAQVTRPGRAPIPMPEMTNAPCDGLVVSSIDIEPGRPPFEGMTSRWRHLARAVGMHHTTTRVGVIDAFLQLRVGQVCTDPALRAQVGILIAEAEAVCVAAGIVLTRDPADAVEEAIREAFRHKPSMLQDVLARRPTEIDVLNGGIADEGRRVGVATPAHDSMVALVHGLETSWQ